RQIPSLKHPTKQATQSLPFHLEERSLSNPSLERKKHREGLWQLGTLGRGNHFLELLKDTEEQLWLMIHSGSRAMGQAIRAQALSLASTSATGMKVLDLHTNEGQAYLHDLQWALDYASANRMAMLETTLSLLEERFGIQADLSEVLDIHHNHVQQEEHQGQTLWVHRKGANAAHAGRRGIIPGSMGTCSFLVEGKGLPESLCSSSHGAGRKQSRSQARRSVTNRALQRQMKGVWFDHRRTAALLDEAPSAYKDIRAVMRAQRELVCITHELTPLLSYKGV
ncbi:MAG: RtcB family protein, partial [Deltaproteobacteria bacterium]